jgi:amino acid transporter
MGCALIILFFVISMTDDLHDQEIVVEENKSLRIVPAPGISALSAPGYGISAVFLVFSVFAAFAPALPSARRPVDRPKVISAAEILSERLYGRAPPASLA